MPPIEVTTLAVSAVAYLLALFLIAYATDRRWLPGWLIRHPAVYVLSLGVYATTWSYYGSVGFAQQQGMLFLTIYLGVTLAFVLTPVMLMPILRLTRTYQLTSVADLFAFRFNSQAAGVLVTLLMLAGVLPYIALQIRAVAESTMVLNPNASPGTLAIWFVVLVTGFAIIFGTRHVSPHEKHEGMVVAIAFESLMKLLALVVVATVAMYQAFGSPLGLQTWLADNPARLEALYEPVHDGPWASLLLLAFAAGFLLPRQFHMLFTENVKPRHLLTASWAFPLYLLALTLFIPPILWSAQVLQPGTPPDYHVLGLARVTESPVLAILAYLGGISAASAMVVVSTLAIASMTLNHLVLPLARPCPHRDLYVTLRWSRRIVIAATIAAGYAFYVFLEPTQGLVGWGLISFLAMAQMLPGIAGLLLWPRATAGGFIAGLVGGSSIWVATVFLPPLTGADTTAWLGFSSLNGNGSPLVYEDATFWSLSINAVLFVLVSLLSRPDEREQETAAVCHETTPLTPSGRLRAGSPAEFVEELRAVMGEKTARTEVEKALRQLGMDRHETRPGNLYALRNQIQRNLSGMMGPVLARMIVDARLELDQVERTALAQNVRLIEERLETSRTRLRGLAAELDRLRRYHRQIIEDLPVGVCAVAQGGRLVRWNPALRRLTGMPVAEVIGRRVRDLPPPWGPLLVDFLDSRTDHWHKQEIHHAKRSRWYSLHKAAIEEPGRGQSGDTILLIEDLTELQLLEQELTHSERLASIGRLAAGVAHEIGNPVTSITCLAQELSDERDPDTIAGHADDILTQAQRINGIVQSLVRYAHGGRSTTRSIQPVNVHDTVNEATRLTVLGRRAQCMTFENLVAPDIRAFADPQQMIQVFVNLFTNAADACDQEGRVSVTAQQQPDWLSIRVEDNGGGIPGDIMSRVMEPFFTTKQPGQGTGLGLPLVYNIIRDCGGQLDMASNHNGTVVTLRLRLADSRLEEGA